MHHSIEKINGITCLLLPQRDALSTTIQVMVKAGSIYEDRRTNGISHFLEHMFFKGGKTYLTPEDVARAVERFGGEFNAYTSEEYAAYYVKSAPEFSPQAIDVLADMMVHAQFPQEEMQREKGVVVQEIAMYSDEPQSLVSEQRKRRMYGDNCFGRSILGPKENVMAFTREDLFAHKQALYTKDNLIIVVAGSIAQPEQILDLIGQKFADLPEHKSYTMTPYTRHTPDTLRNHYAKGTEQNHLIISAYGLPYHHEHTYAARFLATILGGNMSSRLFQNIREQQGLCYYIGSSYSSDIDDGLFFIRAGMDKERFDFALDTIHSEISRLVTDDILDHEISDARGYMIGKLAMGIESSDDLADFAGKQYLLYGKIKSLSMIHDAYMAITRDDLYSVRGLLADQLRYSYWIQ